MDPTKKRLRYQSWHRGCKETDDILGPFADHWLPGAEDTSPFEALLEEDDWDLYYWITGERDVPEVHMPMVEEIREFQMAKVHNTA
jgi:antitoxin CptB